MPFIFEKFHTSNTFDDILFKIAHQVTIYSKLLSSHDGIKWLNKHIGQYTYSGYNVRFINGKYELTEYIDNDHLQDGDIPLILKLCSSIEDYWILSLKREFYNNVDSLILYCNAIQLFFKYGKEINDDYENNEIKYTEDFKAKISHELNGHAIQYLYYKNMNHAENNIDMINADISKLTVSEESKDILTEFFYFMNPYEINARINEITTLFKERGLDILNEINYKEPKNFKYPLSLELLKNILPYIDKNTKLSDIERNIKYIYMNNLTNIVGSLNKKYNFYKGNFPDDGMNEYKIKIFRQLYKIISEDLNYTDTDCFKIGHPEIINESDIPDKWFDLYKCYKKRPFYD